jgi:hypothetical protein
LTYRRYGKDATETIDFVLQAGWNGITETFTGHRSKTKESDQKVLKQPLARRYIKDEQIEKSQRAQD